jgi:hypothetical protein
VSKLGGTHQNLYWPVIGRSSPACSQRETEILEVYYSDFKWDTARRIGVERARYHHTEGPATLVKAVCHQSFRLITRVIHRLAAVQMIGNRALFDRAYK